MHGHPFPGPLQLWWGKENPPERPRNLFELDRMFPVADRFRAGKPNGHIASNARVNRTPLHQMMAKLTQRISHVVPGSEPQDNTRIPSGYTYLLQFIAHDMVDSVLSFNIHDPDIIPGARNARAEPLRLETLYGNGPDESPQAYEFTSQQMTRGLIPRIRLRVGSRTAPPPPGNPYCPFHDIARNPAQWTPQGEEASPRLTEAMIADPRNDAHALVSQLTVLFQLMHNHIVDLVEDALAPFIIAQDFPTREVAYRTFHCARLVLTLIYRNIIKMDVLEKILDKDIYRRYMTDPALPCDRSRGIPLEFTFGAFRFGHAIVRDQYNVNSTAPQQPTTEALRRTALLARPNLLPIKSEWLVDWARFFENSKGITPNFSKRIGPRHPGALADGLFLFPPKVDGVDAGGLIDRDLLSSAYAGLLSVPALIREMQSRGFVTVEDLAQWQEPIRKWLTASHSPFVDGDLDIDRIVIDPPLPFFVLFEAARIGRRDEAEGGWTLGPLGSVIVAEAILGAMEAHSLGIEGDTLQARIKTCAEAIFNMRDPQQPDAPQPLRGAVADALAAIDEIDTMPKLLDYMERQGLFASA